MTKIFEGKLDASGLRFGIVVSRFNSFIGERLVEGALDALVRHGANREQIAIIRDSRPSGSRKQTVGIRLVE